MHDEVADAEAPEAGELPWPSLVRGAMVTHNIRLSRKLGDGGMGSVWLADHLGLGNQVVIKFMSPMLARDEQWTARFRREAELAARVRHPHVVQVFDHGVTSEGVPFIVMELLEGHDLGQEIWDRGRLLPGEVSTIVVQIAKALQRVHELGFVHRDIKPENVFLCDLGSGEIFIKLLDFGIAKTRHDLASSLTSTGVTMGTPYYMSPEVIVSAKHVDKRTDLWALAVIAFEALTGVRPFLGETIGAVTLLLHAEERPRATKHVPTLPAEVDEWFLRALSLDPEQRFPDARSMAKSLALILPPIRNSFTPEVPGSTTGRRDPTAPVATTQIVEQPAPPARSRWRLLAAGAIVAAIATMFAWPSTPASAIAKAPAAAAAPPAMETEAKAPEPVAAPPPPIASVSASPSASVDKPVVLPPKKPKPKPRAVTDFNDVE